MQTIWTIGVKMKLAAALGLGAAAVSIAPPTVVARAQCLTCNEFVGGASNCTVGDVGAVECHIMGGGNGTPGDCVTMGVCC